MSDSRMPLPSKCCARCFQDSWLKAVVDQTQGESGVCPFCGSRSVKVVDVSALSEGIHNLLSIYTTATGGRAGDPLVDLVQADWEIFSERLLRRSKAADLLEAIANADWDDDDGDPPVSGREYSVRADWQRTIVDHWREFCDEVRRNPALDPPFPELFEEDVHRASMTLPADFELHRARAGHIVDADDNPRPFVGAAIGAPPPEMAMASRASVQGVPVLYSSDSETTAVSEAKPSRGLLISVARVRTRKEVRVLNTVDPVDPPNPFTEESLDYWLAFIELLESFGEELGRPLERRDDLAGYLPCQKLAKAVQAAGFDGIRYPSAMTVGGVNVVLFDPAVAEILDSKLVRVIRVTVEHGDADSVTCETRAPISFDSF